MSKVKGFLKTTTLGGIIVLLPIAIFAFLIKWLAGIVTDAIDPLSNVLADEVGLADYAADIIVVILVVCIIFLLGMIVKTKCGTFMHRFVEARILKSAPGYSVIRESVVQLLGNERPAFSQVALANIFGNETMVTAFITDEHPDGRYSVFVPTGPNPMSGNIYHLKKEYVHMVDTPASEAMRSIISCGAGSTSLIESCPDNDPLSAING